MSNTAVIIWKSIGIGVTALLLVAAVVWGYKMTPSDVPCVSISYSIEDADERMYLTENELDQLLRTEKIHPVGLQLNVLSLHRIERCIAQHPMVRTAECYLTPRQEVIIRLTQRVPLMRVHTQNETYYVDTDRRVMQARAAIRDSVLVVMGSPGVQMATGILADFAEWLQDHRYWQARVHHVMVQSPQRVYIYLRGENMPRVLMGNLRGYEQDLAKLRTFLEEGDFILREKNYYELDVRFKGQVIGRKP